MWPAGTCLGIDPSTNQPTDIPIDCAAPHAMEVSGAVNLAEKFPAGLPPEPEQDGFIKDACTRMTDAYLAPIQLRSTTLTLIYSTVSLPSWSAGSHQVSCSIGATLGNGGWSTLLNSAKGPLLINGQPPVPPPDIPEERLNFPPIPMPDEPSESSSSSVLIVVAGDQQPVRLQQPDRAHARAGGCGTRRPKPRRPPRHRPHRATPSSTGPATAGRAGAAATARRARAATAGGQAAAPGLPLPLRRHRAGSRARTAAAAAPGRPVAAAATRGVTGWPCG